jgi:P27 family predicted phage terminase small subunit
VPVIPDPPDAPDWLSAAAVSHWERIAPTIHKFGLLTHVDVETLGMLCESIAHYVELRDHPSALHPIIDTDKGTFRNPIISQRREALADVTRLIRELGMSPAARVGLVAEKPVPKLGEIVDCKGGFAT